MFTGQLPADWEERVRGELSPGESLLWFGKPRPSTLMLQTLPVVLFGVPWTAFALFWMYGASGFGSSRPASGPLLLFPLFGLPFVLIGLGMLLSPLWALRGARRTGYAITNKRAIIFEGSSKIVRSVDNKEFDRIARRERSGGRADLIFEGLTTHGHKGAVIQVSLMDVEDARRVESILRQAAERR